VPRRVDAWRGGSSLTQHDSVGLSDEKREVLSVHHQ